jgi:hypothetical protein
MPQPAVVRMTEVARASIIDLAMRETERDGEKGILEPPVKIAWALAISTVDRKKNGQQAKLNKREQRSRKVSIHR